MLRQFGKGRACGGLKGQLLPLAQGNALGGRDALIKVLRSVRATYFMRGNAPLHCELRALARGIFAHRRKNANSLAYCVVYPGRCPGLWATFGLTARLNYLPVLFSQVKRA